VTVLLVVIGFLGLLLELKVPGTAVPGIISALCFILVFWAHTQFSGQLVVLAGLLFLLGLVLILIEVFVLPGFGVAGVFGIMLLLASLGLVTVEEIPSNSTQWLKFGGRVARYVFALIAAGFAAFYLARFLPRTPLGRQLSLQAPDENEAEEAGANLLPGAALAASLLGAIGVAATVLRPSGTVRFGEQFIDVVTEGGFINVGTRVQVVEVEGTRIVVKEV
jgi:membrane-bound ClpP family serine protease